MPETNGYASLWDWRRRVSDMYGTARQAGGGEPAWLAWRSARDALFSGHAQSPVEAERFHALEYFPYDPALRLTVALRPHHDTAITLPAGADGDVVLQPFAITQGLSGAFGGELTLYWIAGYGGGVFLPFADATNGRGSYGGGRYLLDTIKGADLGTAEDGRAVLDFNYAYNPSCSYSDRYACPLPPPANRLPAPVRGGERTD